jgi:ribosomal protein S18 acetylase RimI-like enzyme
MRLVRVRNLSTARTVAAGVRRYNHIRISTRRVISRPHFTMNRGGSIAGWIGYEGRGEGRYEVVHLSVKPGYRRGGLAKRAVASVIRRVRSAGGKLAYARIRSTNYPSISLFRKFRFRKLRNGRVSIYGRKV